MQSYINAVNNVYKESDSLVIIGLTGRTGSGCSTAARILETPEFRDLSLPKPKESGYENAEERKYAIVHKFLRSKWKPFTIIEASSIILSMVFQCKYDDFINYLEKLRMGTETTQFRISGYDELVNKLKGLSDYFNHIDSDNNDENCEYYTKDIKTQKAVLFSILSDYSCYESKKSKLFKAEEKKANLYTYLLQLFGNNIRSSGNPFNSDFDENHFFDVAEKTSRVVEMIRERDKKEAKAPEKIARTRICIDAFRNPYEAHFFKDKYKSFYLVSVSTEDKDRRLRLNKFDEKELTSLDNMEYPVDFNDGKIFYQQSIAECLQIADIHLYNPTCENDSFHYFTQKLIRYISLMLHPGLITPTSEERCMQIAYNAKFNSGCLSRQVGAVITDEGFYIKAVGWNDVPEGQTPCNLRTLNNFFSENDSSTYSRYELTNDTFRNSLNNLLSTYNSWNSDNKYFIPYCFKDVYNGMNHNKNQVHTRSLHAEENAFLQISKFGGQGIKNGKLFVTASPCELCSKKSYQLGIKDIYYIDPYPGIASSHILKGSTINNPSLHLFYGAIGNAYVSLYTQRFAIKDELQLKSGINPKDSIFAVYDNTMEKANISYESVNLSLCFNTRTDISFVQKTTVKNHGDNLEKVQKIINWSGGTYKETKAIDENKSEYTVSSQEQGNGAYFITIKPYRPLGKDDRLPYSLITTVYDEEKLMNPIMSHLVKKPTDKLHIEVKFKKDGFNGDRVPEKAEINLYADIEKNLIYDTIDLKPKEENGFVVYSYDADNPMLLYTYAIEWDF